MLMVENMAQQFGGEHTELKLNILDAYVASYLQVMKNQTWADLFYVDAFAGSGNRKDRDNGIQDGSPIRILQQQLDFKHYYFNDLNSNYTQMLEEKVKTSFSKKASRVSIECKDANCFIIDFINNIFKQTYSNRAVVFLDPYGMQVRWETIQTIVATRGIDMFCLVPIQGLKRQATNRLEAVQSHNIDKMTAFLGTAEWLDKFYEENPQSNLFGDDDSIRKKGGALESFIKNRFDIAGFSWVANPIELKGKQGYHEFSLFFAMTNPSNKAINLAKRLHRGVVKSLTSS